jgi:5-methylcytosine-specific restriction endonuclease McrA
VSSLSSLQPLSCRQRLPERTVKTRSRQAAVIRRVLAFDPADVYERIELYASPLKRIQTRRDITLQLIFPKQSNGLCDCGCGQGLRGKQRRWATEDCGLFAWYVYAIIAGRRTEIKQCLRAYYGRKCGQCLTMPRRYQMANGRSRSGMEFDHIVPVHRGGGACWLSNYRMLCTDCHRSKTAADRVRVV